MRGQHLARPRPEPWSRRSVSGHTATCVAGAVWSMGRICRNEINHYLSLISITEKSRKTKSLIHFGEGWFHVSGVRSWPGRGQNERFAEVDAVAEQPAWADTPSAGVGGGRDTGCVRHAASMRAKPERLTRH